jgi:ABC-type polar amino acid transport system ATPase subunit
MSQPTRARVVAEHEPLLQVEGLRKRWPDGRVVLDGIDLSVARGDVVVILGPNGSGKSTLLRCLNGLEEYQEGRVRLQGVEVSRGRPAGRLPSRSEQAALVALRQRVGMVFQQLHLFPHLDALHNVMLGPLHVLRRPRGEAREVALAALHRVGLDEQAGRLPGELSGGQQQRVAIARALAMSPEVLLFDEPTSALDPLLVREVFKVIRALVYEDAITMLLVTHDLDFARDVADRVLVMDAGRVEVAGSADQVFQSSHPLVQRFLER